MFYRYHIGTKNNLTDINKISGLGTLIKKLEYDALTPNARKLSDYGVPFKLIRFYDSETISEFDSYEKIIFDETKSLIE